MRVVFLIVLWLTGIFVLIAAAVLPAGFEIFEVYAAFGFMLSSEGFALTEWKHSNANVSWLREKQDFLRCGTIWNKRNPIL
jgi:hypothetical protein